jgi:glycosyltransferase involved in cell wall biosynthesis
MRLICIDGNEANVTQQVGVSVYTTNILYQLKKYASHEVRFCVYLRSKPLLHLPRETTYFRYRVVWGPVLWVRFFLPLALWRDALRQHIRKFLGRKAISFFAFFSPAHYAPPFLPTGCKLVVTIHDLAYEFFPKDFLKKDLYKLRHWTRNAVVRAAQVIAVSESTKQDIIRVYNVDPGQVFVVFNGFTPYSTDRSLPAWPEALARRYKIIPGKYILFVSTLQPRKNVTTLIYAFALFRKTSPDYRLVLVGKKGWMYEQIFTLVKKLKIDEHVSFTGYLTNDEKYALYAKAFCMVLPSLYEGFGIVTLEAFSMSCPVIASNTSAIPEIAGGAALLFDPQNANELVDKLRLLESDLKLRAQLIEKGLRRAGQFSWETCGKETLEVLLKEPSPDD